MSTSSESIYATRGSSNTIYVGFPWAYIKRVTSGVSGVTVKKFRTTAEPFTSGWYKGVDPEQVKVRTNDNYINLSSVTPGGKKGAISSGGKKSNNSLKHSDHSDSACPSTFYGISIADLAAMAATLTPEADFKFIDESIENTSKTYLTCYKEAKFYMETVEKARKGADMSSKTTALEGALNSTKSAPDYIAFTDGGSTPSSGGSGGWGCLLFNTTEMHVYSRSYKHTTNNRMELRSILCALLNVPEGSTLHIYSDSQYAINCCSIWIDQWKKKGLLCPKELTKEAIKETKPLNKDLLLWIHAAIQSRVVHFTHVRGHSGNALNEFVDGLCHLGRKKLVQEYPDVY